MTGQEKAGAIARLKPVAYARKQAGETVFLHTAGVCPDDGNAAALVLLTDAMGQIAARDAEITRLRGALDEERERCANVAANIGKLYFDRRNECGEGRLMMLERSASAAECAHAIRSMGAAP